MKKLLIIMLLPGMVFANGWAAGYTHLDIEGDTLGGLTGSYSWDVGDAWDIELGAIIGVNDTEIDGVKVELDPSLFVRTHYNVTEQFHIGLTYADFSATASYQGESISASGGETGLGIGGTFGNMTISFDTLEDTDMFSFQFHF